MLRINQFESRFQAMSVLVFDELRKEYLVFVKGAPEKIHSRSVLKHENIDRLVESLSLQGLRTICFAYKKIT